MQVWSDPHMPGIPHMPVADVVFKKGIVRVSASTQWADALVLQVMPVSTIVTQDMSEQRSPQIPSTFASQMGDLKVVGAS